MTFKLLPNAMRVSLCGAALLGATLAQAASGYMVSMAQEQQVQVGMTRDQVRSVMGRPAHNLKYRAEPGRTWTYGVLGQEQTVFDVDFSSAGLVVSTGERMEKMD